MFTFAPPLSFPPPLQLTEIVLGLWGSFARFSRNFVHVFPFPPKKRPNNETKIVSPEEHLSRHSNAPRSHRANAVH